MSVSAPSHQLATSLLNYPQPCQTNLITSPTSVAGPSSIATVVNLAHDILKEPEPQLLSPILAEFASEDPPASFPNNEDDDFDKNGLLDFTDDQQDMTSGPILESSVLSINPVSSTNASSNSTSDDSEQHASANTPQRVNLDDSLCITVKDSNDNCSKQTLENSAVASICDGTKMDLIISQCPEIVNSPKQCQAQSLLTTTAASNLPALSNGRSQQVTLATVTPVAAPAKALGLYPSSRMSVASPTGSTTSSLMAPSMVSGGGEPTITIKLQLYGFQNPGSFTSSRYTPDCVLRSEMLEPVKYSTMPITFANVPCDAVQQNAIFSHFLSPSARHEFLQLLSHMAEDTSNEGMCDTSSVVSGTGGGGGGGSNSSTIGSVSSASAGGGASGALRRKFPPLDSPIYWLFNKTDRRAFCFSAKVCLEGNYLDSRGSSTAQLFLFVTLNRKHFWVRENFSESGPSSLADVACISRHHNITTGAQLQQHHPTLPPPSFFDPKLPPSAILSPLTPQQQSSIESTKKHSLGSQLQQQHQRYNNALFPVLASPAGDAGAQVNNSLISPVRRSSVGDCFTDIVTSLYNSQHPAASLNSQTSDATNKWHISPRALVTPATNFANLPNNNNNNNTTADVNTGGANLRSLPQINSPSSCLAQLKDPKRIKEIEDKQNFLAKQHLNDLAESSVKASCVENEEVLEKFFKTPLAFNRSPPHSVHDKQFLLPENPLCDAPKGFGNWNFQSKSEIPLRIFVGNEGSDIHSAGFLNHNNNNITPRSAECSQLLKLITDKHSHSNTASPCSRGSESGSKLLTPQIKQEPLSNYESQCSQQPQQPNPFSKSTQIMINLLDPKKPKITPNKVAPLLAPLRSLNAAENEQITDDVILSPDFSSALVGAGGATTTTAARHQHSNNYPAAVANIRNRPMTLLADGMPCFNGSGMVQVGAPPSAETPGQLGGGGGGNAITPRVVTSDLPSSVSSDGTQKSFRSFASPGSVNGSCLPSPVNQGIHQQQNKKRARLTMPGPPKAKRSSVDDASSLLCQTDNNNIVGIAAIAESFSHLAAEAEKLSGASETPKPPLNTDHCTDDISQSIDDFNFGDDIDEMIRDFGIDQDFLNDFDMSRNDIETPPSRQSGDSCATFPGTAVEEGAHGNMLKNPQSAVDKSHLTAGGDSSGASKVGSGSSNSWNAAPYAGKQQQQNGANLTTTLQSNLASPESMSGAAVTSERKRSIDATTALSSSVSSSPNSAVGGGGGPMKLKKSNSIDSNDPSYPTESGKKNPRVIGSKTLSELLNGTNLSGGDSGGKAGTDTPSKMLSRMKENKNTISQHSKDLLTRQNLPGNKNTYNANSQGLYVLPGGGPQTEASNVASTGIKSSNPSIARVSADKSLLDKALDAPIEEFPSGQPKSIGDVNEMNMAGDAAMSPPLSRIKGLQEVAHELREAARQEEERDLQEKKQQQEMARQQQHQFLQHQSNSATSNSTSVGSGNNGMVGNCSQQQQSQRQNNVYQQQQQSFFFQTQQQSQQQQQRPNSVAISQQQTPQQPSPSVQHTSSNTSASNSACQQLPTTPTQQQQQQHNAPSMHFNTSGQQQIFSMGSTQSEPNLGSSNFDQTSNQGTANNQQQQFQQQTPNSCSTPGSTAGGGGGILIQQQPQSHHQQSQSSTQLQQPSPGVTSATGGTGAGGGGGGGPEYKPFPRNLFRDPVNPPNQTISNFSAPGAMLRDQKSPQPNGPSTQQVYVPAHCVNPPPNHPMRNVNTPSIQQQQQQHQAATHIHQPPLTVKYFQQQPTPHQQPQMYVTTTPAPPHQGPPQQQMQPTEPSVHQVATMGSYQQQFFPGSQTPQPPMIKRIVGSGYQPTIVRAPPLGIQQAAQRFIRTPIDQQQQGVPQTAMFTTLGAHPQLHSPHHIMNGAAAAAAFNRFPQAQSSTGAVARIAQPGGGNGYHIYSMPPSLSQHPQVQTMHGGLDGSQQGLQSPGTNMMRSMPPQGMLARSASVVPQVYHAVPANSHAQQTQQQQSLMLSQSNQLNNSSSSTMGGGKQPQQQQPAALTTPHATLLHHQPPPPQQLNGATTTTMQTDALMQHGAGPPPPPHVHQQQQQAVNTHQQHHAGLVTAGVSANNSNNHISNITCAPLAMTNNSNNNNTGTSSCNTNNNNLPGCQDGQGQPIDRLQPLQMSTNVAAMPGISSQQQHHMNSSPASNNSNQQQINQMQMTSSTNSKMMSGAPSHSNSQNQLQQQHTFTHNVTISSSGANSCGNNSNAVLARSSSNMMNSNDVSKQHQHAQIVGSPVACSSSNSSLQLRTTPHSKSLATTSSTTSNLLSNMNYANSEMVMDTSNNNGSNSNNTSHIGINNNNNVYSSQQSNNSMTNDLKSCSSSASIKSTSSADSEKMTEQMEDLNSIYDDFFSTLASDNAGMQGSGAGSVKMEEERMDTTPISHTSNQINTVNRVGGGGSFNDLESPSPSQPKFMIGGQSRGSPFGAGGGNSQNHFPTSLSVSNPTQNSLKSNSVTQGGDGNLLKKLLSSGGSAGPNSTGAGGGIVINSSNNNNSSSISNSNIINSSSLPSTTSITSAMVSSSALNLSHPSPAGQMFTVQTTAPLSTNNIIS